MGDEELETELITPIQRILDQCRNVRTVARKLVKRVEEVTNESSALKPIFIPRLAHLTGANGLMELALKFGVQLAQQVRLYVIEVKDRKDALKLTRVLSSVRSSAGEIKAGGGTGSWQTASELLSQLQREAVDVLTLAIEPDSAVKSEHVALVAEMFADKLSVVTGIPPWLVRVDEIKAIAAVNVDAERKIAQMNEEMQELVRGIKNRVGDGPRCAPQSNHEASIDVIAGPKHQRIRCQSPVNGAPHGSVEKASGFNDRFGRPALQGAQAREGV